MTINKFNSQTPCLQVVGQPPADSGGTLRRKQMKIADIPKRAFTEPETQIPTKVVPDWDAMHRIMVEKGFVIIESDLIRHTTKGAEESVLVKMFNSHMAQTKKLKLRTARIGRTRWFCTL